MERNRINDTQKKNFFSKVEKTDNCWLWKAATNDYGYGIVGFNNKVYRAHHISYMITNNLTFDTKLFLLHSCDTPECVNPAHLKAGTHKENSEDMMRKGRGKGQFNKGLIPASRKIDEQIALSIKQDLQKMKPCDVIRKYKTTKSIVFNIKRGSSWAWLEV